MITKSELFDRLIEKWNDVSPDLRIAFLLLQSREELKKTYELIDPMELQKMDSQFPQVWDIYGRMGSLVGEKKRKEKPYYLTISTLLKRFSDKRGGKVDRARQEIRRRFDYLSYAEQKRIVHTFMMDGALDDIRFCADHLVDDRFWKEEYLPILQCTLLKSPSYGKGAARAIAVHADYNTLKGCYDMVASCPPFECRESVLWQLAKALIRNSEYEIKKGDFPIEWYISLCAISGRPVSDVDAKTAIVESVRRELEARKKEGLKFTVPSDRGEGGECGLVYWPHFENGKLLQDIGTLGKNHVLSGYNEWLGCVKDESMHEVGKLCHRMGSEEDENSIRNILWRKAFELMPQLVSGK